MRQKTQTAESHQMDEEKKTNGFFKTTSPSAFGGRFYFVGWVHTKSMLFCTKPPNGKYYVQVSEQSYFANERGLAAQFHTSCAASHLRIPSSSPYIFAIYQFAKMANDRKSANIDRSTYGKKNEKISMRLSRSRTVVETSASSISLSILPRGRSPPTHHQQQRKYFILQYVVESNGNTPQSNKRNSKNRRIKTNGRPRHNVLLQMLPFFSHFI
jgi:hypothetical protein